jgi:hypothetical protein
VSDYNGSRKGYPGRLMIARHDDVKQENITKFSVSAVDFLGFPYGKDEIIRIAARIGMHSMGFKDIEKEPVPQHEFICSEYAHACYKSIGVTIDYNETGFIAPADFARHPKVKPLCYIHTETEQATCAPLHGEMHIIKNAGL